jgi:predicted extracellular nuclease
LHILALQTYAARGAGFSSTGSANLQRKRWGKKCSSTGRCKLERVAPAQTILTHLYAFNKNKQTSINHK